MRTFFISILIFSHKDTQRDTKKAIGNRQKAKGRRQMMVGAISNEKFLRGVQMPHGAVFSKSAPLAAGGINKPWG